MALLEVKDLQVSYGLIKAIKGISFEVNEGEIVVLIGANGAGKTTTMHAISSLLPKNSGRIVYDGVDITSYPAYKLPYLGMSQVPEGRRIFQELSVRDNLIMGAYSRNDKAEIAKSIESVYAMFPILKERATQIAGTLSGGEQQMLAMARAMMSKPKIVLLDEPSMGLSPLYVQKVFDIIQKMRENGTTILLVEQNAKQALQIADRAYVLETGRISISGDAKDLMNDESIKKAYLS